MWKKVAIAAAVAAGIVGAGTAAVAATGTSSTSGSPGGGKHLAVRLAGKNFQHGEWVARNNGQDVTHAAIRGTVTAVSPSSITVTAADQTSWAFTVDAQTKVMERENGKGSGKQGAIADVHQGDHVLVAGTENGQSKTAKHVLDTGTN